MIVYNKEKYEEIKQAVFKKDYEAYRDYTDDDFLVALARGDDNFLGSGCTRKAYFINDDFIYKISSNDGSRYGAGDNETEAISYEALVEYGMEDYASEIYATFDDYTIIFAERLDVDFTIGDLIDVLGTDRDLILSSLTETEYTDVLEFDQITSDIDKIEMISSAEARHALSNSSDLSCSILDELEDYFHNFEDVHQWNIGFDRERKLKMLDLGHGLCF